jgi:hypothetical protein
MEALTSVLTVCQMLQHTAWFRKNELRAHRYKHKVQNLAQFEA